MESKKIPLIKGNGKCAIVDASDYDRLMQEKWFLSDKGYALRTRKNKVSGTSMHRVLLDPPKGMMADHINGDRLDNRRSNLRIVSALQNAQNRKKNDKSRSKYKGVAWKTDNNKWQARIRIEYSQHHIGLYDTEEEAAYAYNMAAIKHHGEYARLNKLPDDYIPFPKTDNCPLCHQPTKPVSVSLQTMYKTVSDEWTYLPATKDDWISMFKMALDAAGVKYVD